VRLASGGADIIGVDIVAGRPGLHYHLASQHDLQETIELIERTGRRAIVRPADVRDLNSLTRVVNDGVRWRHYALRWASRTTVPRRPE
jgi:(+)-trans-carveol dehydrogenase